MHFSEVIKLQFDRKSYTLLYILKSFRIIFIAVLDYLIGISICHYGGWPRFLAAPPLTLNLPLMM